VTVSHRLAARRRRFRHAKRRAGPAEGRRHGDCRGDDGNSGGRSARKPRRALSPDL